MLGAALALIDKYGGLVLAGWLALMAYRIMTAWHADMAGLYIAAHAFATGHPELVYPTPGYHVGGTPAAWLPRTSIGTFCDGTQFGVKLFCV